MPRWLIVVIVVGVALDLVISGVLIAQQHQVNRNQDQIRTITTKASCWDSVLDRAVTDHPTRASLIAQAQVCRNLPPSEPQHLRLRG